MFVLDPLSPKFISIAASAAAVLLAGLAGILRFMFKETIDSLKKDWDKAMCQLDDISKTTKVQAENHLHTIEGEAVKQTALLSEMIREQSETNGYLRAVVDMAKPKF